MNPNQNAHCTKGRRCFIVVTHIRQFERNEWQTTEEVEITDRLKKRHIQNSSVIIDVLNQKFFKNRFVNEGTEEDHLEFLLNYIDKFKPQIEAILSGGKVFS